MVSYGQNMDRNPLMLFLLLWMMMNLGTALSFMPRTSILSKRQVGGQGNGPLASLLADEREPSLGDRLRNETRLTCYECTTFKDPSCRNNNSALLLSPSLTTTTEGTTLGFPYPIVTYDTSMTDSSRSSITNFLFNISTKECSQEEGYCTVTRVEYMTNEKPKRKFWVLERGCAVKCIEGCIILGEGERTKLHLCNSCCTSNLCNISNSSFSSLHLQSFLLIFVIVVQMSLLWVSSKKSIH